MAGKSGNQGIEDTGQIHGLRGKFLLGTIILGCDCHGCQRRREEEDSKTKVIVVTEGGKAPVLVLYPEHYRKVKVLICLRKALIEVKRNKLIWKEVIEKHDLSNIDDLSKGTKEWLERVIEKARISVAVDVEEGWLEVVDNFRTIPDLIRLMAGTTTFVNDTINNIVEQCRKIALGDNPSRVQEEIRRVLAALPEHLHDATEIEKLEIPLGNLGAAIKDHNASEQEALTKEAT